MNLTIKDLLQVGHADAHRLDTLTVRQKFNRVSSDSRTIRKGDLFVALRGQRFDGHHFIEEVRKQGARAAIVDTKWFQKNRQPKLPCLVVKNTLDAFGELAGIYRRKFSIPILLVAGSNGKTTTKDLIAHTLGVKFNVLKTEANFNNQVGLPQMLFRLEKKHQIAVLEIGTNHPGEIAWLSNVAEPTHALVTNIGKEHLEFFKDLNGVAREELSVLAITESLGGFAFINIDDPFIQPFHRLFQEWSITYGIGNRADVRATGLGVARGSQRIKITAGKHTIQLKSRIIADYAPNMIAGVTAVALHFGLRRDELKKAIESYTPHSKRMEMIETNGITIINDAYNANPESFRSALATLDAMKSKGRKYVVAGDMFELGNASAREHRDLGKVMAQYPVDGLFFAGNAMKHAYKALSVQKRKRALHGPKRSIVLALKNILNAGDILLVKGSRGMKMEEIIEELRSTNSIRNS